MNIKIEIDEKTLTDLVVNYLSYKLNFNLKSNDVVIQVKSKQNYKSEWETASFRAIVNKTV